MPRGVYDRSKTKKKLETAPKSKMPKTMKVTKSPIARSPVAKSRVIKDPGISTEGRFRVLTENISTMVKMLSLNVDKKVFAEVVAELTQNFNALKALRLEIFGDFPTKTEQVEASPSNGGLPLPAKPLLPVPPVPSQS
jgi:hypothetical protein